MDSGKTSNRSITKRESQKHNKTTVQIRIREDMKKMVQLPVLKNLPTYATAGDKKGQGVFGVSLMELSKSGSMKNGMPSVLRSMVEYLIQHGLQQEGLFRVSASVRAVESLKQRIDRGEEVDFEQEAEVSTVASLLKLYLRELPEGLIHSSIHNTLIQLYNESSEHEFPKTIQQLLLKLPDVHYSVLRYLCHFLTQVEEQQCHNRMTAFNLATVFGPNVFHVSPGFEGIQEQDVCNKIMARLIEKYRTIFEPDGGQEQPKTKPSNIIMVKEAHMDVTYTDSMSTSFPTPKAPIPLPRKKKATQSSPVVDKISPREKESSVRTPVPTPRKKKVKRVRGEAAPRSVPQPVPSTGLPFSRHLAKSPEHTADCRLHTLGWSSQEENMDLNPPKLNPIGSMDTVRSSDPSNINSIHFFSSLSYRSSSVGSDHTVQPLLPMCISEPRPTTNLSPVHHCSFLGALLIDTDNCRLGTPHKSCIVGATQSHPTSSHIDAVDVASDGVHIRRRGYPLRVAFRLYRTAICVEKCSTRALNHLRRKAKGGTVSLRQKATRRGYPRRRMWTPSDATSTASICDAVGSQEDERPISPFYVSSQLSPGHYRPDLAHYLERTIRSAVEQHLFDAHMQPDQGLQQSSESAGQQASFPITAARQRRRQQRESEENRERSRYDTDKENIPSSGLNSTANVSISSTEETERRLATADEDSRSRKAKYSPTLSELSHNQGSLSHHSAPRSHDRNMEDNMEATNSREAWKTSDLPRPKTPAMKIQEAINGPEPSERCEDVPRLDLSALMEDSNWGEPVPAYSSWHRDNMDSEEAHLSPHSGGKMIRQLLEEDSDPMVSPRFYAYGNSQQYLDDTEVPPSPPNTHSFISRRRSSSLGSCDNEVETLTSTQLSKKIHNLRKKIRKFEEKFEEERKYRPSHSDKAANPEVLRWMNELAKLRKDLKEHSLLKSEEDLAPLPRQRSNTLPKSFGSQLEKKSSEAKTPKPPVESTLETVMNKLLEKRTEAGRPEDIKARDMTREQIGTEKVALQKALLYYEGIHGRPITKTERQLMKPLYDRYRLVKQILCRASTIPVIGSPSSKRRGPQLQPIIEGEPALFFDHGKEEEDGSDEDGDNRTQFAQLTVRPELSMLGLLEHLDEEVDGFVSPVDELSPSKNSTDMRLSNLHAAPIQELVEQLQEAREEKKRIRKNLREFEDQFFRQNGRNVQKEDRSPLAEEYNEYKHIKAKLKLLEVLISKRDSAKLI
ncbi:protein FAM13A isoform X4 [Silurus meridionalis]|nr:protein FAM13A isoform X4 [Silurus meridionalis]